MSNVVVNPFTSVPSLSACHVYMSSLSLHGFPPGTPASSDPSQTCSQVKCWLLIACTVGVCVWLWMNVCLYSMCSSVMDWWPLQVPPHLTSWWAPAPLVTLMRVSDSDNELIVDVFIWLISTTSRWISLWCGREVYECNPTCLHLLYISSLWCCLQIWVLSLQMLDKLH